MMATTITNGGAENSYANLNNISEKNILGKMELQGIRMLIGD